MPDSEVTHLRVKAGTAVATAACLTFLVLLDWDHIIGRKTVFSGIRPAVKSCLNSAFGVPGHKGVEARGDEARGDEARRGEPGHGART